MKMEKRKRMLAFLLSIVLAGASMPISALAAGFGAKGIDTTLYTEQEKNSVKVTLVIDASANPQTVEVKEIEEGATGAALGVAPKKRDFLFEGWYLDSEYETPFDGNKPIAEDMTLYASWGKMGDVNDDGEVTISDALMVLKSVARIPQEGYLANRADCNGEDGVTIGDAVTILEYIANIIQNFEDEVDETVYAKTIVVKPKAETMEGEQYATLKEAFAYVNANPPKSEEERIRILISPGTYREHLILKAPYITLEGNTKNAKNVLLTWYYGCGRNYYSITEPLSNSDSASVYVTKEAHDFVGKRITFENSYSLYVTEEEKTDYSEDNTVTLAQREKDVMNSKYKKQALALCVEGDRSVFKNCRFLGVQDTLLLNHYARVYLKDCFIEGTTDFIFGSATAVFDGCQINVPFRNGYLTASSAEATAPYGFLFTDCSLTREARYKGMDAPKDGSCTLGRPWGALCQVIFWNCKMDKHIISGDDRYVNMSPGFSRDDCRLLEGNTMDLSGNKLDLSTVLPNYMKVLTEKEYEEKYSPSKHLAAQYDPGAKKLKEADGWNPMEP